MPLQQLQLKRNSVRENGWYREKYYHPSWNDLQGLGYEITELVIKEVKKS